MSSQPLTRHDRRKLETRSRIRSAAAELFGERGVDATKVADICEQADIARQTFFNHFPSKTDLLREFFAVGIDFTRAAMDSACQRGATTRERLRLFLEDITGAAIEVGPMHRDLTAQVIRTGREAFAAEQPGRLSEVFQVLVDRGLELGDVTRRHEPAVMAELVEGGRDDPDRRLGVAQPVRRDHTSAPARRARGRRPREASRRGLSLRAA